VAKGPVNVSAWKQAAGTGSMTITVTRPSHTLMAPAAIWFEAEVTGDTGLDTLTNGQDRDGNALANAIYDYYDQQFHELEFEWSFGDTGTWAYASRLPSQLRQRDYGHGRVIAHVFSTPGDKTVTCNAYRMGTDGSGNLTRTLVATKTVTFEDGGDYPTIRSMEDAIPLSRRIYFDPDGTYDSEPVGATLASSLAANTLWRCGEWAEAQSKPDPVAILVKRGTEHTYSGGGAIPCDHPNLYIGSYGTGDRPRVNNYGDAGLFNTNVSNWTGSNRSGFFIVDGIEVVGDWDVVTETGSAGGPAFGGQAISHHLAHDCLFRDMDGPIISTYIGAAQDLQLRERSFVICDTEVTGWRDYGLLGFGGKKEAFRQDTAVIGSKFHQPANASMGLRGNTSDSNVHGPLRIETTHHLVVRASDFFSKTDWGSNVQPCLRIHTVACQQWEEEPGRTVIYGNSIEGGADCIRLSKAGLEFFSGKLTWEFPDGTGERSYNWPHNVLVKHNLLLGAFHNLTLVGLTTSSTSIVENVGIRPDVKRWNETTTDSDRSEDYRNGTGGEVTSSSGGNGYVVGLGEGSAYGRSDGVLYHPVRIIGNVTIDLKDPTSASDERTETSFYAASEDFEGLVEFRDNTIYAPNYSGTAITSTGPWDFVENIAPRETQGVRHDANVSAATAAMTDNVAKNGIYDEDTSYATPGDGLKLYRPASDAAIANGATGPASHRDFFGTVRPAGQKASRGAMEPG
jgi:hypothetical protein